MFVGQEIFVGRVDSANGDVFTSDTSPAIVAELGLERAVITHIGDHTNERGNPLCWIELVDRNPIHQANGAFRPATQLFLTEEN